jgi:hypothetical protein
LLASPSILLPSRKEERSRKEAGKKQERSRKEAGKKQERSRLDINN